MSSPYDQPQPVLGAVTDRGEKILLRPAEMRDVDAIFAACTDPESQRWTTLSAAYGLLHLGLERVEWKAHVGNVASRRVAEKAGFTFEGTLRAYGSKDGRRVDEWIASLLPADLPVDATVEVIA